MLTRRILISLLLANFALVSSVVCYGQSGELKSSPVLERIFTEWNNKEGRYSKSVYDKTFKSYIRRQSPLEPDRWKPERIELWNKLPETLTPKLTLSSGAQQLLISMYSENATEFERKYWSQDNQEFQIKAKLYLIFSLAQQYALKSNSNEIQPSHVFTAIKAAFTGVWPFCPRKKSAILGI